VSLRLSPRPANTSRGPLGSGVRRGTRDGRPSAPGPHAADEDRLLGLTRPLQGHSQRIIELFARRYTTVPVAESPTAFPASTSEELHETIASLEQQNESLQETCDERLAVIEGLKAACDERLAVIDRLNAEVGALRNPST
jgi:hypothetical protein